MDEVGLLVKALIQENAFDELMEYRKPLEWAAGVLELGGEHQTKALEVVIEYAVQIGRCPKNTDDAIFFVQKNDNHVAKFEQSLLFGEQLRYIGSDTEDSNISAATLINSVYQAAQDIYLDKGYRNAAAILSGAENPYDKGSSGPEAAEEYLREHKSRMVLKKDAEISGNVGDNIDYMKKYLDSFIIGDSRRVYTGFRNIDEKCLIGRKQRLKWIGILGYTHHCKSLFLTSMLYNMAAHGANIMLCPRESSVEETWMNFVWLHHQKVCPDRPIAKKDEWMRSGKDIGKDKYDTIQIIMDDLAKGETLPGKIFVYPCDTWDEVEDKLKSTNKKNKYDVLAIDYFAHLDIRPKGKETERDAFLRCFRRAQELSVKGVDGDNSGLVVITPLQANKNGYEETSKQEGDDYGVYKSPRAVEQFTQAAQDMDLLLSVWHEGDSCVLADPPQLITHCLKGRGNMKFITHRLEIDPDTSLIADLGKTKPVEIKATDMSDLSDIDADDMLFTKTSINTDSWGT